MKVESRDGRKLTLILSGLLTSKAVCGAVAARWEPDLFGDARWANLIGKWCVEYFKKYREPPGRNVIGLFDRWANSGQKDKETVAAVDAFLSGLADQPPKKQKAEYIIDLAGSYFTQVSARSAITEAEGLLEDGEVAKAVEVLSKLRPVDVASSNRGVNFFEDEEAIRTAFEHKSDPVCKFPGGLGNFFGDALERDGLIALEGAEKSGKTWMALAIAYQMVLEGRRVAFFEIGDLSEHQILRRFAVRHAGRPLKAGAYKIPVSMSPPPRGSTGLMPDIVFEEKTFDKPLNWRRAVKACKTMLAGKSYTGPLLKVYTCPIKTINVHGIEAVLDGWQRHEEWVPDGIFIDYADILAPVSGGVDSWLQIDENWQHLRRLSQTRHALVVSPTQIKGSGYGKEVLGMEDYAGAKTKRAHVTGSVGINQKEEEKALGVYRLNWIAGREWEYDSKAVVWCAGSLALAHPLMMSCF